MSGNGPAAQVVVPLQSLLTAMSDGVLITDEYGHRTYANSALSDLVGMDPCEAGDDPLAPAWLPDDQHGRYRQYLAQAQDGRIGREIVSLEWRLRTATGREIPALIKLIPMRGNSGVAVPLIWLIVPDRSPVNVGDGDPIRQASLEESLRRIAAELERVGVATNPASARRNSALAELSRLSPRETEVLDRLLEGHRVTSIAGQLEVSEHTVRNHLKSMFRKLGVHSQAELVGLVRNGTRAD
jgi:PAS domain S-box-containing protein